MNKFPFEENLQRYILYLSKADSSFLLQTASMVKPEYFEQAIHCKVFTVTRDHYLKYNTLPTDSQIIEEVKSFVTQNEFIGDYRKELDELNLLSVQAGENREYILDKVEEFAKRQSVTEALYSSVDFLKQGKYEQIFDTLKSALKVGRVQNLGETYIAEGVDSRYARLTSKKNNIGLTPFNKLNERLDDGGLSRGELALVIAATGVGKSIFLANQAVKSSRDGLNVLFISLEMSEDRVAQRLDSIFTRIPITELKDRTSEIKYRLKLVEDRAMEKNGVGLGRIKIKQFPGKSLTIPQLRAYVQQLRNYENFTPDILIIDYLDEMSGSDKATYEAHQEVMQYLRGLAVELNVLVWTATQTNREAHKVNIITEREVGDSYGKLRPCEFIVSINQTLEEKDKGLARLYIMKNRNGVSKFLHPIKIDSSRMTMVDSDSVEIEQNDQTKADSDSKDS